MNVSRRDLEWAASQGIITPHDADTLWSALESRVGGRSRFDLAHVAYYFGAMVVISAMAWFMTQAWERFGGGGILLISLVYATCFALAGRTLYFVQNLRVPGGLLFTVAVWMTPLAVYGLERMVGIWPQQDPGTYRGYYEWVKGGWFLMEIGTILVGLVALRFVRFPFLTFPIAFALWFMSMDLTPLLYGRPNFTWTERLWVSLWFGLAMLLVAYLVDRRTEEDFAFWGYLFGMLAFWCGLSLMESRSELARLGYCLINVALIGIAVLLDRRVFLIFGALGVFGYLGHLSYTVFKDSLLFPFALSAIGIAIIALGVLYQRNQAGIERAVVGALPPGLRALLPKERLTR
ncbi:MAG TPA: DUF2157 domain-containing protein [Methylomirabilota bacterium]|nr:DUF2157 domain-containing protein [Methylomirabilota bacterium]